MLLAEQIGSWSPPPPGPCWKWHLHMARPRRLGLVRSLAHDNAEGLSALLGHAGIRNRICRIIHLGARGVSRRGGIGPEGLEARGSVLREGVCWEYVWQCCCPALTLATMLLAEQIGSWSPPPPGPCWKWHLHMARPRRLGLVRSLAHDNAEGLSALLGHAGIRNRICRIIHLGARGVSRRGGIGPEGLEARGSVLREGVCWEYVWQRHPSRSTLQGQGSGDAAPLREVRRRGMSATTVYH